MTTLSLWLRLTLAWDTGNVAVEASPLTLTQHMHGHEVHYSPMYVYWDTDDKEAWFASRLEASIMMGATE